MSTTPPDPPAPGPAAGGSRRGRAGAGVELAVELRQAHHELLERLDGLTARLDDVTDQAADARAVSRENAGLLSEALPCLDDLTAAVAELRGQVTALTAQPKEPPNAPVHWPTLTAEQAERDWAALAGWVEDVLGPWYRITRGQLPDCWALHPPAVVLLSVLRTAYVEVFFPRTPAAIGVEWHTSWLPDTLTAIATAIPPRWCRPGEHQVDEHASQLARAQPTAPPPTPYGPPASTTPASPAGAGGVYRSPREEITTREHWGTCYEQALAADLEQRRAREAEQQARAAAAASPAG